MIEQRELACSMSCYLHVDQDLTLLGVDLEGPFRSFLSRVALAQ